MQYSATSAWVTVDGVDYRVMTGDLPNWSTVDDPDDPGNDLPDPGSDATPPETVHAGWYLDLDVDERVVSNIMIRGGKVLLISFTPQQSPCGSGGHSVFHQLLACTGGATGEARFDVDGDGLVANSVSAGGGDGDVINIGTEASPVWAYPSGIKSTGNNQLPVILSNGEVDINYSSSSTGGIETTKTKGVKRGIVYWLQVE